MIRPRSTTLDDISRKLALGEWLSRIGPALPEASVFVPQNSNKATAYLARPGATLPEMQSLEELVADLP